MKTWQVILRLLRFDLRLYAFNLFLQILRFFIILVPGLILRELFNTLTGNAGLSWGTQALLALLVASALVRFLVILFAVFVGQTSFHYSNTRLLSNLIERILDRPDARLLPFPPGDVINRLRQDAGLLSGYLAFSAPTIGGAVAALTAIVVMVRINPLITLVVLVPLVAVGAIVNLARTRLEAYRRASRTEDGRVSAFLREMFSSVQAVQVATAESRAIARFRQLSQARRHAALRERLFNEVITLSALNNIVQLSR